MVVLVDEPRAGIRRLRINRPDKRNAIDYAVREAFIEAFRELTSDASSRAVVIGGVDGVLSAGGDVPSMQGITEDEARARMQHIHTLVRLVAATRLPVITAAEGFCAGAAVGLALLGDHIVVGAGSKILFPFFKLGLIPDWASLETLPRRVGTATARRIMSDGRIIGGEEAYTLGLADEYVADADVMEATLDRAEQLSRLPGAAYARFKTRLGVSRERLEVVLQQEEDDQAALLLGPDFQEGFAAFTEKREPDFTKGPA